MLWGNDLGTFDGSALHVMRCHRERERVPSIKVPISEYSSRLSNLSFLPLPISLFSPSPLNLFTLAFSSCSPPSSPMPAIVTLNGVASHDTSGARKIFDDIQNQFALSHQVLVGITEQFLEDFHKGLSNYNQAMAMMYVFTPPLQNPSVLPQELTN